ncbi:Metal-dependent hydrolase, endonuclease/exonuclease/phosphatase family [Arachidicoccus rhizosphaerae]|uniref:Metal-dependent hydrolase, endonuclease/exonuclease/phosphatase family n=2 Tax=Arachidicoccus rhizosphaerae TaxID=551991 RepID=A0A1H3XX34_9BACT|nr:Metal-dependent hydrolase, endonuclease/exonuclease/phosphatase family [Arachidicoccus rhizosphaerae]
MPDHFTKAAFSNPPKNSLLYVLILVLFMGCNQPKANGENQATGQSAVQTEVPQASNNNGSSTIKVVNWNIEWLGSASNGPKDKALQLANAIKILQYLKADMYCLCEIVDPQSLKSLTAGLGGEYSYALSDYAAGARSKTDPGYANSQKLAFIYNNQVFKNVQTSGYLRNNARIGYYFASGRYPFELDATVHTAQTVQKLSFLIIHAKSGADLSSYERRLNAATGLKAALDQDKAGQSFMLLGDFNDHLDGSITAGKPSPYDCFVKDPAYQALTLPLSQQRSTLDYSGVIDQQIISGALYPFYKSGSARIRTDIIRVVPDFKKGHTSDHYPVSSEFIFSGQNMAGKQPGTDSHTAKEMAPTDLPPAPETKETAPPQNLQLRIFAAAVKTGSILVTASQKSNNIQFILYNKRQHKVLSVHRKYILKGDTFKLKTPSLYAGDYTLVIFSDHGRQVIAFTVK